MNLNYSTELQYEIDKVAEEKAKNSLEVANLKKMTLLKYTSEKQITSLMSDIETAKAKVDSDKNSYNINLNRENRYREISANCKIKLTSILTENSFVHRVKTASNGTKVTVT